MAFITPLTLAQAMQKKFASLGVITPAAGANNSAWVSPYDVGQAIYKASQVLGIGGITANPDAIKTASVEDLAALNSVLDRAKQILIENSFRITAPTSLPNAAIGPAYPEVTCMVTGGTPPYRWQSIGLPERTSINRSTGVISGRVEFTNTPGTKTVQIIVSDSTGRIASKNFELQFSEMEFVLGDSCAWSRYINENGVYLTSNTGVRLGIGSTEITIPESRTYYLEASVPPNYTTSGAIQRFITTVYLSAGDVLRIEKINQWTDHSRTANYMRYYVNGNRINGGLQANCEACFTLYK